MKLHYCGYCLNAMLFPCHIFVLYFYQFALKIGRKMALSVCYSLFLSPCVVVEDSGLYSTNTMMTICHRQMMTQIVTSVIQIYYNVSSTHSGHYRSHTGHLVQHTILLLRKISCLRGTDKRLLATKKIDFTFLFFILLVDVTALRLYNIVLY
jgi:uncharacterized membrane protein YcgQ (UPF0703/DUF1980 family)